MKKGIGFFTVLAMALLLVSSAVAQPGRGQRRGMQGERMLHHIPDLTDQQKEKIKKIRMAHQKEMLEVRNQMGELHAKLRTLETAEKADVAAINSTIDKMGKVRTEMHKKRAAHKQEIRKLLTDEQRLAFDTRSGKRKMRMMRKQRKGRHGKGHRRMKRDFDEE